MSNYATVGVELDLAASTRTTGLVGVYLLIDRHGVVVYVGQSIDVSRRVASHVSANRRYWRTGYRRHRRPFARAHWLPLPVQALDTCERALIAVLKPRFNCHHRRSDASSAIEVLARLGVMPGLLS